ncbi:MAG: SprT family zinc-dependent metalloprotease [Myxococcota bacterium]
METSVVTYGTTEIPYRIRRSDRRTTVAVTVAPGEGVVLMAPTDTAVTRLDRVVRQKAPWIVDRLRHVGQVETVVGAREFVSGESYAYLGRTYRLKVMTNAAPDAAKLDRGWLRVPVERDLTGNALRDRVCASLESWYMARARARIPPRVAHWTAASGLDAASVMVKRQAKRWASCDASGNLRFNWQIIQAPMRLVDYVIVHELAHTRHIDHTKAFWALVGTIMPDYEQRRAALRVLGPRLQWS